MTNKRCIFQLRKNPLTYFKKPDTVYGLNVKCFEKTDITKKVMLSKVLFFVMKKYCFLESRVKAKKNYKKKPDNPRVKPTFYEKTSVN